MSASDFVIEIELPSAATDELAAYTVHPGLLQACLRPIEALLPAAADDTAYRLGALESFRLLGRPSARLFSHFSLRGGDSVGAGPVYDLRLFDEAGQLAPVQGIFHYLTFGVQVTLPVRNKNQGNIEAAQASLEAARNRRQFGEIVVRNEVAAAYARFARAQAALAVYRDGVRGQAVNNLEVIRQTYEFGQKSLLDFVSEQRRFIEVETGYTDALKEYLESLIEIKRAAGAPVPTA